MTCFQRFTSSVGECHRKAAKSNKVTSTNATLVLVVSWQLLTITKIQYMTGLILFILYFWMNFESTVAKHFNPNGLKDSVIKKQNLQLYIMFNDNFASTMNFKL